MKQDAMALKEMDRLKRNCNPNSSIYVLFMIYRLPLCSLAIAEFLHRIHARTSGTNHAIMRYMKSSTLRHTVAIRCWICGTITLRQAHLPASFEGDPLTSCRRGYQIETCFPKAAKSDKTCIRNELRRLPPLTV